MTGRQRFFAILAGLVSTSVATAILSNVLQEDCPAQRIHEVELVCCGVDPTGTKVACSDTSYVISVGGRVYWRNQSPDSWHRWTLTEGTGSDVLDAYGDADGVLGNGAEWAKDSTGTWVYFGNEDAVLHLEAFDFGGAASFSVSAWFRLESWDVPDGRIVSMATGTAEQDHWFMLSTFHGNQVRVRLKTDAGTTTLESVPDIVQLGTVHRIKATYDGAFLRLWLDGSLVGSKPWLGLTADGAGVPCAIGNQPEGKKPLNGWVRDVIVW